MASKIRPSAKMRVIDDTLLNKQKSDHSYWKGTGRYEKEQKILLEELATLVGGRHDFDWRADAVAHWALLNGMAGLYYGYYNDGDKAAGAIDNGRVHGYQSVQDFQELAYSLGAKHVVSYLKYSSANPLEKAMDEAIMIVWNKEKK
jgi:hypothetical protein